MGVLGDHCPHFFSGRINLPVGKQYLYLFLLCGFQRIITRGFPERLEIYLTVK